SGNGTSAVSKSREANELTARVNWIVNEVQTNPQLTREQFDAYAREVTDLKTRADWLSGFTADKEIGRQGGDTEVVDRDGNGEARGQQFVRVDGTASSTPGRTEPEVRGGYKEKIAALRSSVIKAFGSTY